MQLRFPGDTGRVAIVVALVMVVLLVGLCVLEQREGGFVFAAYLVCLIAVHHLAWGVVFFRQYREVGTKAWAGDGMGVLLDGFMLLPLLGSLVVAVPMALIVRSREKKSDE
jgi:hypothetical protein